MEFYIQIIRLAESAEHALFPKRFTIFFLKQKSSILLLDM